MAAKEYSKMSDEPLIPALEQREVEVQIPHRPEPVHCIYTATSIDDSHSLKPALVFTHGAGGSLKSDAIADFAHGFASYSPESVILCFQGNINLKSRVKMFKAVINDQKIRAPTCFGGRSMGARAAIMASNEEIRHLILVSYPLHTDNEVRDEILLNLPNTVKVIFISGDHDNMCDPERLEKVRKEMKCLTWRVLVQNADHGMNVSPKARTHDIGRKTGEVAARWLESNDEELRVGSIVWNAEEEAAQWSGWSSESSVSKDSCPSHLGPPPVDASKTTPARKRKSRPDELPEARDSKATRLKRPEKSLPSSCL